MNIIVKKKRKEEEGGFSFVRFILLIAVLICVGFAYLSTNEQPDLYRATPKVKRKPKSVQGTGYTDYVPNGKGGVSIRSEYAGDVKPKGSDK